MSPLAPPVRSWFRSLRASRRTPAPRTLLRLEALDPRVVPAVFVPSDNPGPVVTGSGAWQASGTFRDVQQEFRGIIRLTAGAGDYVYESGPNGQTIQMRIDPTGSEQIGDRITVRLTGIAESDPNHRPIQANTWTSSYDPDGTGPLPTVDLLTGQANGMHFSASRTTTFVTEIGKTFDISFRYTASGATTNPPPVVFRSALFYYRFATEAPPAVDVQPTLVDWDEVNGGVNLAYTNSAALPNPPAGQNWTYDLAWLNSSGSELGGAIPGGPRNLATGQGSHQATIPTLTAPPATATQLLFKVNTDQIANETATNNTLSRAYEPEIESVTAKYDGTGAGDTIFGRFFTGFSPIDQTYTVTLSRSVAALQPTVEVNIGGHAFTATRQSDGVTYKTGTIDPGQFSQDQNFTVKASVGGAQQGSPWTGTLDMEALPAWVSLLNPTSLSWSASSQEYTIEGKLFDINTPALLDIPDSVWLAGKEDLKTKLTAQVGVKVVAGLDPTPAAAPDVTGTLDLAADFLGRTITPPLHYQTGGNGPFTFTLNLDPRTLALTGGTATYTLPGPVTLDPVDLSFGGKFFQTSWYKAKSQVEFTPSLDRLVLTLTIDSNGRMANPSSIDVGLGGALAGKLDGVDFNLASRILPTLRRAAGLLGGATPSALAGYLVDFLQYVGVFPTFEIDLNANGNLALGAKVDLMTGRALSPPTASMTLGVSGQVFMTWLGDRDEIFTLDDIFNTQFGINLP